MAFLLDTHFVLWSLAGDKRIPKTALDAIADPGRSVYVSTASIWEIAIKLAIGKLKLQADLPETIRNIRALGFTLLPIKEEHIIELTSLPHHHRDPFDRMLIAQAMHEKLQLITVDPHFKLYDVPLLEL